MDEDEDDFDKWFEQLEKWGIREETSSDEDFKYDGKSQYKID